MILDYEYVKSKFEERGYSLLSKEYKNARTKLLVKCDNNHLYTPTFDNFISGCGCSYCAKNGKITLDKLNKLLESLNYIPVDTSLFKNSKSKIIVKCNENHIFSTSWNYLNSGQGCPRCNGGSKISYNEIKSNIEKTGYTLLSKNYRNANTKILLKCNNGHVYKTIYSNFYQGHRCPECNGGVKLMYENVKKRIESENGYKLLSTEYQNNSTKLSISCSQNHLFEMNLSDWTDGNRCKYCSYINGKSKGEKEVLEYIKSIYNGIIVENDRTTILNNLTNHYLELDIWLPDINVAIEYNGLYWHSDEYSINNDTIKLNECKDKGIILFIIIDNEWKKDKEQIKEKIKSVIFSG